MAYNSRITKGIAVATGIIAALFLIIAIGVQLILTPKTLNSIIGSYSSEHLNATVKTDTIGVNIFKNFPYLTLTIKNGEIVSTVFDSARVDSSEPIPLQADSLLKFKELHIAISLPQLLKSNINIRRIGITKPVIYACVLPDGTANYNLFKEAQPESQQDSINQEESSNTTISVNRISIKDGAQIVYNSSTDSTYARIDLNRLHLRGNFSTDITKFEFKRAYISKLALSVNKLATQNNNTHRAAAIFKLDSLNITNNSNGEYAIDAITRSDLKMNNTILANDFPFEIHGGIKFDTTQALKGELQNLKITAAKIPVVFNGDFNITPDSLYTNNICGKIENHNLSELFKYIPKHILQERDKIKTNAAISIDVDINGSYNFKTGKLPSIIASLDIPESYIEFEDRPSRINQLETHIKAYYSATNRDSAAIEIHKAIVNGRGIQLALNGKISDLATSNPYIDMQFKGAAFLDTLSSLFPAKSGTILTGNINAELITRSRAANLNMYNIGNANIKATLTTDTAKIVIPQMNFLALLQGVHLAAATTENTQDSSIKLGTKMLGSNITADSIYFKYKEQIHIATSKFRLAGHQASDILGKDSISNKVYPFNGEISAKTLNVKGFDSTALRMRDPKIKFSILPHNEDYTIPVLNIQTDVRRLMARDLINRISIGNGNITLQAILNKRVSNKEQQARLEKMLDSLQKVYPSIERDSLMAHSRALRMATASTTGSNDFAQDDPDFRANKTIRDIIRTWNLSGKITAKNSRIITPYFPLRTRMQNVNFNFTTDKIEFTDTKVSAGQSKFTLTGKADRLRRAMLRNGVVNISGKVVSDTLNFNELIAAANKGAKFIESSEAVIDSLARFSDEDKLADVIEAEITDSTLNSDLLVIPGNINADFILNVKYGIYSNLKLHKMSGELLIKERCMQISGFEALTDAGDMSMNAFYATRSKEDLSTGFDLELKDVAIEKFITLMPGIDSLLPMLKSFEGKVNCTITATSKIDTAMNLILPTLRGVARITGENLVLMDGETFATIAKKLKFKNREKNYIDKLSVELLLNNSKIEVFPFIAEMDRYKFAISGTQNLDMSFLYNVSILQSPIPFRVGVKIFGNTDDFDFKIGKAQYKSDKLPVFSAVIDSARINLREHIANIYRTGIDAALKTSSIDILQKQKQNHDTQYVEQMDSLNHEEQIQYEMIKPKPSPQQ